MVSVVELEEEGDNTREGDGRGKWLQRNIEVAIRSIGMAQGTRWTRRGGT